MRENEGPLPKKFSVRRHVAKVLTEEILQSPHDKDFALPTEQQLSQRFAVSLVTVRLALEDLVHKGLIYRRQGRGTFAYGSSTRANRTIGVFVNCLETMKLPGFCAVLRGALAVVSSGKGSLVLVNTPPDEWSSEMAGQFAGVIVLHESMAGGISRVVKERNLPFLLIRGSHLLDEDSDFFEMGRRAAQALSYADLTGEPVGEIKVIRKGFNP
jgi:hypothetical protein